MGFSSGWQGFCLRFSSGLALEKSFGAALPAIEKPCLSLLFYLDEPIIFFQIKYLDRKKRKINKWIKRTRMDIMQKSVTFFNFYVLIHQFTNRPDQK